MPAVKTRPGEREKLFRNKDRGLMGTFAASLYKISGTQKGEVVPVNRERGERGHLGRRAANSYVELARRMKEIADEDGLTIINNGGLDELDEIQ